MENCVKEYQKIINFKVHQMIISALLALDYNLGIKQAKRYLLGDISKTIMELDLLHHPYFGIVQFIDRKVLDHILDNLLELGFIELETVQRNEFNYQKYVVSGLGKDYLEHDYEVSLFKDKGDFPHGLFKALVDVIIRFKKESKMSFTIKNETLIALCHALPEDKEDFLMIDGMGPKLLDYFYEDFLAIIKQYKETLHYSKLLEQSQASESR